jgi:hypothetical protein
VATELPALFSPNAFFAHNTVPDEEYLTRNMFHSLVKRFVEVKLKGANVTLTVKNPVANTFPYLSVAELYDSWTPLPLAWRLHNQLAGCAQLN